MLVKKSWLNFIWQPVFAVIFVIFILFFMEYFSNTDVLWAVGAGSLSSSCFIIFGKPMSPTAKPKNLVGAYWVGILSGCAFRLLKIYLYGFDAVVTNMPYFHVTGVLAALSVGLCLFLMIFLRLEHPPAAGIALVLVIDMNDYSEVLMIMLAVLVLAAIRWLFRNTLVDLI